MCSRHNKATERKRGEQRVGALADMLAAGIVRPVKAGQQGREGVGKFSGWMEDKEKK